MQRSTILILTSALGIAAGFLLGKSHGPFLPQIPKIKPLTSEQKADYKKGQPYTTSPYWQTLSESSIPDDSQSARVLLEPLFTEWTAQDPVQAFEGVMQMPKLRRFGGVTNMVVSKVLAQEGIEATIARIN